MSGRYWIWIVIIIIGSPLLSGFSYASDPQEKEDLLFEELPIVITASRREQPLNEAPTTITVISAEEIKYSGATSIPDLLRNIAGVDVMAMTARDQQVSIRGLNAPVNNKLLVMLDGRSIYLDIYGMVQWDALPIGMEEIERIEIVKSPASSLYGANAFCGVINIISKTPSQVEGTELNITLGSGENKQFSLLHGNTWKKMAYKFSAGWEDINEWESTEDSAGRIARFNGLLEYRFSPKGKVDFSCGTVRTTDRNINTGNYMGIQDVGYDCTHFQIDSEYGNVQLRLFYKKENANTDFLISEDKLKWDIQTIDAEVLHNYEVGEKHMLVWGMGYRANWVKKNQLFLADCHAHIWSVFFEDQIKLSNQFNLTFGARYDNHCRVDDHISPRGNITFTPHKHHILRFSIAKAFRNPASIDTDIYIYQWLQTTLEPPLPAITIPYLYHATGNPDLKAESIVALELGYTALPSPHVRFMLNLFYNHYDHFFLKMPVIKYYEANAFFPGSPGGVFPREIFIDSLNGYPAQGIGGEIALDYFISDAISAFFNYAYQEVTDLKDNPATTAINEKNYRHREYPLHKVNAGIRFSFNNGISGNVTANWVDKTDVPVQLGGIDQKWISISDYLIVNSRIGWEFSHRRLEIALAAFNLFNNIHEEYPYNSTRPDLKNIRIGRRINLTVRYRF